MRSEPMVINSRISHRAACIFRYVSSLSTKHWLLLNFALRMRSGYAFFFLYNIYYYSLTSKLSVVRSIIMSPLAQFA